MYFQAAKLFLSKISPRMYLILGISLAIAGGVIYHKYTVGGLEDKAYELSEEVDDLKEEKLSLAASLKDAEATNKENLATISALETEIDANRDVVEELRKGKKDIEEKYKNLIDSTQGIEDAPISPRLLEILNQLGEQDEVSE